MMTSLTVRSLRSLAFALVASAGLALSTAHAATPVVDASDVPFSAAVALVGVDVAWDGGLVLVLGAADDGALGNALVPSYDADDLPTDALGRVVVAAALDRAGIVMLFPGGVAFVLADVDDVDATIAAFAHRLTELGYSVDHRPGDRVFAFERAGIALRAVFGATDGGLQVYLGS